MHQTAPFDQILLLDDTDVDLFISKKILEAANFAKVVHSFQSGKEALNELFEKKQRGISWPQLMFVDVRMPEMDGFEFIQKANELRPKNFSSKFILVTNEISDEIKNKVHQNKSIYKVFRKPFTIENLQSLLPE